MTDELHDAVSDLSRRGFLKLGTMGAVAMGLPTAATAHAMEEKKSTGKTMVGVPFEKKENPKIGMIGTGGRGTSLLGNLLAANAQVIAVCDVAPEHAQHASSLIEKAGQKAPTLYTKSDHDYENLVARDDLDLVIIATPWNWHVPMAVASMKHGHHTAVEVPAATTLEDCWSLVNTSEETRRHCMMLENCCYGYNETLVLRLINKGMFGELLYGEGAYLHDLREELFSTKGEGLWRRAYHTKSDGNIYPTHGLGPVANYMGIERGDRFDYMVSMSSPEYGLDLYRKEHLKADDPRQSEKYINGDMNISLIKTAKGRTITVKHDVSSPHPYDRVNQIAGTKGVFYDYPPRIYFDGQAGGEAFTTIDGFKEYQHPLWKNEGEIAQRVGGHGGMDFMMLYRLVQCLKEGIAPDMDVYDAASWSAPGPLSKASLAQGSAPVKFPDFTHGEWQKRSISAIATQE